MRFKSIIFSAAVAALLSAGCTSDRPGGRHTIAVSIPPQASLLKEIAGDSITVVTMLGSDANPEAFEPSVADMKGVYDADLYIAIGDLPFEHQLIDRLATAGVKTIDSSTGITPLYGTHGSHGDCAGDHRHGEADPHTWTSIRNMRAMAATMLNAVIETDPDNEAYYRDNHSRLAARLDSLDNAIATSLKPLEGKAFLVWHPSLSYFARDYGLRQMAVGSENKETSAAKMKENLDLASSSGITVFFIQANFDSRQAENLSRQLGLTPVTFNPLDPEWENQIKTAADAIVSAYTD